MKAGLIGHGIAGSLTPALHEAEARAQGFAYRYGRFDTATPPYCDMPLAEIITQAASEGYAGLNVTHPFKAEAVALCDTLSDTARLLGAVNTIVLREGVRAGYNTDNIGFRSALQAGLRGAPIGSVLLIGAGGAGGAVALALIDQGTDHLTIFDKDIRRARGLENRLCSARPRATFVTVSALDAVVLKAVDGVVNATPMGMDTHPGMALDAGLMPRRNWVADIVYFPLETALLSQARAKGCRVMTGAGMAVYQAVAAFAHITGHAADAARMAASFDRLRAGKSSGQEAQSV